MRRYSVKNLTYQQNINIPDAEIEIKTINLTSDQITAHPKYYNVVGDAKFEIKGQNIGPINYQDGVDIQDQVEAAVRALWPQAVRLDNAN